MNQLGIKKLLENISVGEEFSCATREFSYSGKIVEIHDTWMVIEEYEHAIRNTLKHVVEYSDIYWHSAELKESYRPSAAK